MNATCANASGTRTCTCKTGYSGDGVTCNDVNECLSSNGGCDVNAVCANTPGSRTCTCPDGYTGTGLVCTLVPPPSPISTWKFEKQTTQTTIADSTGSNPGNVVTTNSLSSPPLSTMPAFVIDRKAVSNGALRLDGVTSSTWVLVPSSTSLNSPWVNNKITVTIWIRMNTVPTSGGVTFLDRGGNTDATPVGLGLFNGKPQFTLSNAGVQSSTAMPDGTWTFLAGVFDGNNVVFYVNGDVVGSRANAGVTLASSTSPLSIGAYRNVMGGYATGFPNADIDEIRLYGAALAAGQVKAIMQQ